MNLAKNKDPISNWHEYGLLIEQREIFLSGGTDGIGSDEACNFIKNLKILETLNESPVVIHQYSTGGCQSSGFAIYDAIKSSRCQFIFICHGSACSMGSLIPQAVSGKGLRVTQTNCEWMIHEGSCELNGTAKSFISHAEALKKMRNVMYDIYSDVCQSGSYFKNKRPEEIKNVLKRRLNAKEDWTLYGVEAVKYGFVDGVFGSRGFSSIASMKKRLA